MVKQLMASLLILIATSISADEIIESSSEFEQLSAEVSFGLLDENRDGAIDQVEASADQGLSLDFPLIAKEGKLDLKGYTEWKANAAVAEPKQRAS